MTFRGVRLLLLVALVAVGLVVFGMASGLSDATGVVPLLLVASVLVAVLLRSETAVLIGASIPYLWILLLRDLGFTPTLVIATMAVTLAIATARSWQSAPAKARTGALCIGILGAATLILAVLLVGPEAGGGGGTLAVASAAALGVSAAVVGVRDKAVVWWALATGVVGSLAALRSADMLRVARSTVVLGTNANGAGFVAALGVTAAAVLLWRGGPASRVLGLAGGLVCGAALFAAASRGAFVALLVALASLALHRRLPVRGIRAVAALAAFLAVGVLASLPVAMRFGGYLGRADTTVSDEARRDVVVYAIRQGVAHPLTGVGLGRLHEFSGAELPWAMQAHNVYAGTFAECGAVSLVALLVVCVGAFVRARSSSPTRLMPLVVLALTSGLFITWWGANLEGSVCLLILGSAWGSRDRTPALPRSRGEMGVHHTGIRHHIPASQRRSGNALHSLHTDVQPGGHA